MAPAVTVMQCAMTWLALASAGVLESWPLHTEAILFFVQAYLHPQRLLSGIEIFNRKSVYRRQVERQLQRKSDLRLYESFASCIAGLSLTPKNTTSRMISK